MTGDCAPRSGSTGRQPDAGLCKLEAVSEPVRDVSADSDAVRAAVANARRGVITHLTIAGERVGTVVWPDGIDLAPEPLYEQARAHPLVAA